MGEMVARARVAAWSLPAVMTCAFALRVYRVRRVLSELNVAEGLE